MIRFLKIWTISAAIVILNSCNLKPKVPNVSLNDTDCIPCDRINLVINSKKLVQKHIWNKAKNENKPQPLLYFTTNNTYIAFLKDTELKLKDYEHINCNDELKLIKLNKRLDKQPFHMENKMSFGDSLSMFYYRPMMLCSDVETMHKFIPDFTTTEDWLQLVMHEYFHSFQFSHNKSMTYLSQTIQSSADTLNGIYNHYSWFQKSLQKENTALLKAINTTTKDSLSYYLDDFFSIRTERRNEFKNQSDFNLNAAENFWETIEGTARYIEYYTAGNFKKVLTHKLTGCDTLFNNFKAYKNLINFENNDAFKQRTKMMEAYYYVTGFNMCRLMDKIGIDYKTDLFDKPEIGLYNILSKKVNNAQN